MQETKNLEKFKFPNYIFNFVKMVDASEYAFTRTRKDISVLVLVRSSLITVLDRFIDNDLDTENTKALSLILVFKINFKFCKNGGCAKISNTYKNIFVPN
jgi:hypothetical protein